MGTLGEKIKYLRERQNISQEELGKRIGVSRSTVSMYEQDEREPPFETKIAITSALNADASYLLRDDHLYKAALEAAGSAQSNTDLDPDIQELLQQAKDRPEVRALFSLTKNATKEDVEKTIDIIKVLRQSNTDFNNEE